MVDTTKTIKNWAFTKLMDFESCAYKAFLKHVERIPEEKAPAAERGTAIHQLAEDYVVGKLSVLPVELKFFKEEFESLRTAYSTTDTVSVEGEWGFDKDWTPCDYKTAWLRVKLDARVAVSPTKSVVIDYKTGKRQGNEIKHGEQVILYGLAEVLRQPEVEIVEVELWYIDIDEMHSVTFTRAQLLAQLPAFEARGLRMTTATEFPPNPNIFSCRFCPYSPAKGGQCVHGVSNTSGKKIISDYRKQFP
jgi:CRISPR/Cas system-associated exonuclease Cas4 (RecB family)